MEAMNVDNPKKTQATMEKPDAEPKQTEMVNIAAIKETQAASESKQSLEKMELHLGRLENEPGQAKKRGRPSKGEGSSPGRKREVAEFRKPASEITNHYAAFDRLYEEEKKLVERKKELAREYEAKVGKKIRVDEPLHALDSASAPRKIPQGQARAMAMALYAAPARMLGVECMPGAAEMDMLGDALADLSGYYSMESEGMAWITLCVVSCSVFAPAMLELRSKKAGTWEADREKFKLAGLVK